MSVCKKFLAESFLKQFPAAELADMLAERFFDKFKVENLERENENLKKDLDAITAEKYQFVADTIRNENLVLKLEKEQKEKDERTNRIQATSDARLEEIFVLKKTIAQLTRKLDESRSVADCIENANNARLAENQLLREKIKELENTSENSLEVENLKHIIGLDNKIITRLNSDNRRLNEKLADFCKWASSIPKI